MVKAVVLMLKKTDCYYYYLVQLEEERQVTARLSKSLELERRKVESLEQKSKVMFKKESLIFLQALIKKELINLIY